MRFAVVGSGAVGGYYGAKLQRAGHDVTLIARGRNLAALRERGMTIVSAALGDFQVRPRAEESADDVRDVEVVLLATKTYDNDTAIPLVKRLIEQGSKDAFVLSLQNGVSSPYALAEAVGEARVLAGPTYVATALVEPGRIVQTGAHRRIAFGEVFDIGAEVSVRAKALHEAFVDADIISEPHA
ncbi:MAG: NAD(P)-binding domain-containing protein, partial [Vicinamibacteria bacterium]|nr:NAD(P)-binding domain-containing protein [Vicinamibacteria bacterium]